LPLVLEWRKKTQTQRVDGFSRPKLQGFGIEIVLQALKYEMQKEQEYEKKRPQEGCSNGMEYEYEYA